MVRPTAITKIVSYNSQEEGSHHTTPQKTGGPHGEAPGSVRRQREPKENMGRSHCDFHR